MMRSAGGGFTYLDPPPTMAFEFNEESGTILTDAIGARTMTTNANVAVGVAAQTGTGIEFLNVAHTGLAVSGTDVFAPTTGAYAIEVLFYLDAYTEAYPVICQLRGPANPLVVLLTLQSGYLNLSVTGAGISAKRVAPGNLAGAWKHVVVNMLNATATSIYINNVSQTLLVGTGWTAGFNVTKVGCGYDSTAYCWDGKVDFFRHYDRALSPDEITTLYGQTGL